MYDYFIVDTDRKKKVAGFFRPDTLISIVKLRIGNVMQQRTQFNHKHIGFFGFGNAFGQLPYPENMPPIVTTFSINERLFYEGDSKFYYFFVRHFLISACKVERAKIL